MMVDIVSDSFLDEMSSNETPHIYSELIKRYSINYSTLLRYASKRNRQEKVLSILKKENPEFEKVVAKIYLVFNLLTYLFCFIGLPILFFYN